MDLKNYSIILASRSPRRAELLEAAGIPFEIRVKNVDEIIPHDVHYSAAAEYLAGIKAEAHRVDLNESEIIIAADTIVVYNELIYGKPTTRKESIETLLSLSGQEHFVYSGVCFLSKISSYSFSEKSIVKFATIKEKEAEYYFDNYDPTDKAGSYGIQDWLGLTKVEYIKGSYTNILGLPLAQCCMHLESFIKSH